MIRNLKNYRWELVGNKITTFDKKADRSMPYRKVAWVSLCRFCIGSLDRLRTEDLAKLRKQIIKKNEQIKKFRNQNKDLKQQIKILQKDIKSKYETKK